MNQLRTVRESECGRPVKETNDPIGHVFVLNGPSSAGKTTLARALQDHIGVSCVVLSIDHFYDCVHPDAPNNWLQFSALTEAVLAGAVSFANRGFDVVVDTVFERVESLIATQTALTNLPHSLVAVTCPIEVLETREQVRGNRSVGLARGQYRRVFQGAVYALTIDTALDTPETCAKQLAALKEPAAHM